ncbi:MAG: RNA polymerase sigma factor [Bacteroidota bacterium]
MSLEDFKNRVLPVKNKLFRFAMRLAGNVEDAEDMVQEVFIKVWDQRQDISTYHNTEAWCMRLVKNLFLDEVKSKRRQTSIRLTEVDGNSSRHEPMDTQTPYQVTERNDTMQKVQELMGYLSDKQQQIIHLRDVEGYSYQEIAEVLDIDVNQVKVNLFRARTALRKGLLNAENYGME